MRLLSLAMLGLLVLSGCDDPPKKEQPKPAATPAATTEIAKKPEGPPELAIDDLSPKVGFSRVLLKRDEDRNKLKSELEAVKSHFEGNEVKLKVARKAKMDWVQTMFSELSAIGVSKIVVSTDTREEFPKSVTFTPLSKAASDAKPCTTVTMVLEDRGTATWRVKGGTASKRTKGFAGPDFTMTRETLERYAKSCKDSDMLLVSAADSVEWGLAYDLAASATKLDGVKFGSFVLLLEPPVAGRKVELPG